MDFSFILIIICIIISLVTYFFFSPPKNFHTLANAHANAKDSHANKDNNAKDSKFPLNRNANKKLDIPDIIDETLNNKGKTESKTDILKRSEKDDREQYTVLIKTKNELTKLEFQTLENQYNEFLFKKGGESYNQSLKDNSRICMVYEKNSSKPIAQASILVLDTHDFWGAFSKIRNLNLDTQSVILYNVCVEKEHRCRGIGQQMMQSIHHWCTLNNKPNIVLFVNPTNTHAIRLYEKMGYYVDKSHYAPNGSELLMRTQL
jgi:ribosomal protein S18 acetylase RimI-like enzyme